MKNNKKLHVNNNKNEVIRSQSTSGGAFSPIAEYVIENKGVVFGAIIDENMRVYHAYTEIKDGIQMFRGSKYVQSDLKNTFLEAKSFLDDGRMVCFSGTPCQIQGLKSFLGKEYEI